MVCPSHCIKRVVIYDWGVCFFQKSFLRILKIKYNDYKTSLIIILKLVLIVPSSSFLMFRFVYTSSLVIIRKYIRHVYFVFSFVLYLNSLARNWIVVCNLISYVWSYVYINYKLFLHKLWSVLLNVLLNSNNNHTTTFSILSKNAYSLNKSDMLNY